ncbi:hypothetical protein [Campylobacter ureolyticus]|uniref:hypothetical protein n=1 Tax=Campylobacter ureolyticus TaxID=827 RepID=UPI00046870C1|nr:hypothetical protein [Campylobacter ureolyticus]MDK8323182.1 hypothetical protein [Campylobacter ureolyticus]QIX86622.1 hypothetical protein FOB81_04745 [Campylobacter ureolyticus]STA71083.1 Uncharacterised protein [Campylobacter ureolyticus]
MHFNKIDKYSFYQMNYILNLILWFFIVGSLAFLLNSYKTSNILKISDMNISKGKVLNIDTNKSNSSYYHFILANSSHNKEKFYFEKYKYEIYKPILHKNIIVWSQNECGFDVAKQIQINNGKMIVKFDYDMALYFKELYNSKFYKQTYFLWGVGALILFLIKTFLIKIIKRR